MKKGHVYTVFPDGAVRLVSSLSGPWFVGELIEGQVGACFSFGVFVGGSFLQGGLTFVVGILQVCIYKN